MVEINAADHAHRVAAARPPIKVIDEGDVHHLPFIPDTDKFLYVGKNYRQHQEEFKRNDLLTEMP